MPIRARPPLVLTIASLLTALTIVARASGQSHGQTPLTAPPALQQAAILVGQETCAACHEAEAKQFARSAHGELAGFERNGQPAGCEACHGAGSRHAESGEATDIRGFKALPVTAANDACLSCHRRDQTMAWPGSEHAMADIACVNCHRIHQSRQVLPGLFNREGLPAAHVTAPAPKGSLAKPETELCLSCHAGLRAKLNSASHHPVREGRMTCSSCHDVHGNGISNGLLKTDERPNELCTSCHTSKQGPFVFEHAPVEEDCMTCHDPHGAVSNNLLKQGEPFLCLQCHEMHFHNARVAPATPFSLPAGGSVNPNGVSGFQRAFGTRCTACHSKIHGSDLPSQGVTGRGKALTR